MITEDYVSFEVAKLLKEKGFNEYCRAFWRRRDWMDETAFCYCGGPYDANGQFCLNSSLENHNDGVYLTDIAAPTLQMAMKWLRQTFGIHCQIDCPIAASNWVYGIRDLDKDEWLTDYRNMGNNDTYEETCEAAIRYVLENLI